MHPLWCWFNRMEGQQRSTVSPFFPLPYNLTSARSIHRFKSVEIRLMVIKWLNIIEFERWIFSLLLPHMHSLDSKMRKILSSNELPTHIGSLHSIWMTCWEAAGKKDNHLLSSFRWMKESRLIQVINNNNKEKFYNKKKNKTTTPSFIFHGYVKKDFGSFSLAQSTSHSVTHNRWRWGIFTSLSPVCDPQYWWKHWIISFDVSFVGLGVVGKFSLKSSRMFQSWFIGLLADSRRKLPRTYWRIRSSLVHMCQLPERRIDYGSHKAEQVMGRSNQKWMQNLVLGQSSSTHKSEYTCDSLLFELPFHGRRINITSIPARRINSWMGNKMGMAKEAGAEDGQGGSMSDCDCLWSSIQLRLWISDPPQDHSDLVSIFNWYPNQWTVDSESNPRIRTMSSITVS